MELQDYSGPFNPNLKFEDLSKDFIIKLIREYSNGYLKLGEFWLLKAAERVGFEKAALEDAVEAWGNQAYWFIPKIAKAANIEVKDIVDAMKVWQLMLDGFLTGRYTAQFEIKDRNHVIHTNTHCADYETLKKNNMGDAIKLVCGRDGVEIQSIRPYLQCLVPNAEVKQLLGPPESGFACKEGICCQWEYTLKSK